MRVRRFGSSSAPTSVLGGGSLTELEAGFVGFFDNLFKPLVQYVGEKANVAKALLCAFFGQLNSETYAI